MAKPLICVRQSETSIINSMEMKETMRTCIQSKVKCGLVSSVAHNKTFKSTQPNENDSKRRTTNTAQFLCICVLCINYGSKSFVLLTMK